MLIENVSSIAYIDARHLLNTAKQDWRSYKFGKDEKSKNRALTDLKYSLDPSRKSIYTLVELTYVNYFPYEKNNIGFTGKAALLIAAVCPQLYYLLKINSNLNLDQTIEIVRNSLKVSLSPENNYMTIARLKDITGLGSHTITNLRDSNPTPDVEKGIEYVADILKKAIERKDKISTLNRIILEYISLSHNLLCTRGKTYNLNFNKSEYRKVMNRSFTIDRMNKMLGTDNSE
jgi:uncharacterized ubiquitin-like protein YukD